MALKHQRQKRFFERLRNWFILALVVLALLAIYPGWNEIWYHFGQSLYHLLRS